MISLRNIWPEHNLKFISFRIFGMNRGSMVHVKSRTIGSVNVWHFGLPRPNEYSALLSLLVIPLLPTLSLLLVY